MAAIALNQQVQIRIFFQLKKSSTGMNGSSSETDNRDGMESSLNAPFSSV